MLCALTVRQLKPGTFDRFAEEFGPRESEGPPRGWVRFDMLRDLADENRVVTFGFFDGTLEERRLRGQGGWPSATRTALRQRSVPARRI